MIPRSAKDKAVAMQIAATPTQQLCLDYGEESQWEQWPDSELRTNSNRGKGNGNGKSESEGRVEEKEEDEEDEMPLFGRRVEETHGGEEKTHGE